MPVADEPRRASLRLKWVETLEGVETMRRMMILLAGVLLVLATGCGGGATSVTADDDGGSVTLRRGDVLTVELEGNPTTGYTWSAADVPACLELRGEPEFEPDSDALGASGTMTLSFEATEVGEGDQELWYARPWESVQPERIFTLEVTVK
jgi:inhibitor of cysteine peptidase